MNFDEIVVKESPGLCRCCLSEGCYKDLGTEYTWMNENEVYADMLLECFDISISQHNDGPNGSNRLICEVCITRLRDACNFKKQVLDSEKRFVDMLARGEFQPKMIMYQATPMKSEQLLEEPAADDVEYLEDMDFEDDLPLNQLETSVSDLTSAVKVKGKRGRPKKTTSPVKSEKKPKVAKLESKPQTSKAVTKELPKKNTETNLAIITKLPKQNNETNPTNITYLPNKNNETNLAIITKLPKTNNETDTTNAADTMNIRRTLMTLMTEVVKNSTAVPFRFPYNKYLCFYCFDDFVYCSDLLKHTKEEHEGQSLKHVFRNYPKNPTVKLDITDLACKRCSQPAKDLNEYVDHAKECHNFLINKEIFNHVHCFKLSDDEMSCLQCDEKFKFFGGLLSHTHKLHNKLTPFVCEICGKGFPLKQRVDEHVKQVHAKDITYPCKKCKQVFTTYSKMKYHLDKTHKPHLLKCPHCLEVFESRVKKNRHLATVHNVKDLQHPCPDCGLVFDYRSHMVNHRSKIHLKEMNATCHVCGFKTFDKTSLKLHLVSHSAERPFQCEYCKKMFQRKRTLEQHERIHKNERRYVCKDCGKAFIQVTSLRVHSRTHHSSN